MMGEDLLRVIEDSRKSGKILAVLNSTFIVLIPKTDCPMTLMASDLYLYAISAIR